MSYVTRFGFTHPDTAPEMNSAVWFNLGRIEYWQYREQQRCDVLWWYESPSKHIGWRTTVKRVERFPYASLDDADTGMNDLFDKDIDPGTSGEKTNPGHSTPWPRRRRRERSARRFSIRRLLTRLWPTTPPPVLTGRIGT